MKGLSFFVLISALFALSACAQAGGEPSEGVATLPKMTVYKSPTCGCCGKWVEHVQDHGFEVVVIEENNVAPRKQALGVPRHLHSCHTAEVAGYSIEGHVPATDILRLLQEKPEAKGLAVPGMPIGSPGMEVGDRVDDYKVWLFGADGHRVWSQQGAAHQAH